MTFFFKNTIFWKHWNFWRKKIWRKIIFKKAHICICSAYSRWHRDQQIFFIVYISCENGNRTFIWHRFFYCIFYVYAVICPKTIIKIIIKKKADICICSTYSRWRRYQYICFIVYISCENGNQKFYLTFWDNRILSFFLHIDL